jgi:hypothetical protein
VAEVRDAVEQRQRTMWANMKTVSVGHDCEHEGTRNSLIFIAYIRQLSRVVPVSPRPYIYSSVRPRH